MVSQEYFSPQSSQSAALSHAGMSPAQGLREGWRRGKARRTCPAPGPQQAAPRPHPAVRVTSPRGGARWHSAGRATRPGPRLPRRPQAWARSPVAGALVPSPPTARCVAHTSASPRAPLMRGSRAAGRPGKSCGGPSCPPRPAPGSSEWQPLLGGAG